MCGEFFLESHDTVDAVFTGFNTLTCIKLREKIFFFFSIEILAKISADSSFTPKFSVLALSKHIG